LLSLGRNKEKLAAVLKQKYGPILQ